MRGVQRKWIGATVGAALLFAGATSGITRGSRAIQKIPAGDLAVAYSSELGSYLTPCGCSSPMIGGVPRRATFLKSVQPSDSLIKIEGGDFTKALGRQDEMKAETFFEVLNALGYDVLCLGEQDFRLTVPYLQSLQGRFKGSMLASNVRTLGDKSLFTDVFFTNRNIDGRKVRVAIVGVISTQYEASIKVLNPDVKLIEPSAAIDSLQSDLLARSDVRILVYHGPKSEAAEIAKSTNLFRLILFSHESDKPDQGELVASSTLAGGGRDGKYIAVASLDPKSDYKVSNISVATLGPEFADDKDIMPVLKSYLDRIDGEDLLGKVPKLPTANGGAYVGSATCKRCHAGPYRIWHDTPHAEALKALENVGHHKDPECVVCHVVGLEWKSGFKNHDSTPQLENVGCESCHGPSSAHVADPTVPMLKVTAEKCEHCHTVENSPGFSFAPYWERIKH